MRQVVLYLIVIIIHTTSSFAADKPANTAKRVDNDIAVFDLEVVGKIDKDIARPLSDSVRREFIRSGKYEVIDRSNMNKMLKEQSIRMAGCTQKDCAVNAGQLLGVGRIVVGSVSMIGQTYYFSLSLVNVGTGKTEKVEEEICKCEIDQLILSSKRVAGKLISSMNTETAQCRETVSISEHFESRYDENIKTGKANAYRPGGSDKGIYAGIYGVVTTKVRPEQSSFLQRLQPSDVDIGTGLGIKVGYSFNKYLALEGATSSSSFRVNEVTFSDPSVLIYVPDDRTMESTVISLDVKAIYPSKKLAPYVQLGYGQYNFTADFQSVSSGLVSKGFTVRTREIRAGGGISIELHPTLFLDLRYITAPVANMAETGLLYRF